MREREWGGGREIKRKRERKKGEEIAGLQILPNLAIYLYINNHCSKLCSFSIFLK